MTVVTPTGKGWLVVTVIRPPPSGLAMEHDAGTGVFVATFTAVGSEGIQVTLPVLVLQVTLTGSAADGHVILIGPACTYH